MPGMVAARAHGRRRFRAFAAEQGLPVPERADAERLLEHALLLRVASAKWGSEGLYTMSAALDPDVRAAAQALNDGTNPSGG